MNLLTDLFGKTFFTDTSSRLLWYGMLVMSLTTILMPEVCYITIFIYTVLRYFLENIRKGIELLKRTKLFFDFYRVLD